MTNPSLTSPVLHGFPVSPNVRAARLAFAEKRVPVRFEEIGLDHLATDTYAAINPFRKMPALRHGELILYETPALMVYADGLGTGDSLQPSDLAERATMWKFIGVAQNYLYPRGVMELFFHRVLAPLFGLEPNDALAATAAGVTSGHLDVLEAALPGGYLAGQQLSLADLYCGAMVDYVAMTREGAASLGQHPRVAAWLERLRTRDSFRATFAPVLEGKAQR